MHAAPIRQDVKMVVAKCPATSPVSSDSLTQSATFTTGMRKSAGATNFAGIVETNGSRVHTMVAAVVKMLASCVFRAHIQRRKKRALSDITNGIEIIAAVKASGIPNVIPRSICEASANAEQINKLVKQVAMPRNTLNTVAASFP
jgi:hypothetical protein